LLDLNLENTLKVMAIRRNFNFERFFNEKSRNEWYNIYKSHSSRL